MQGLLIPYYAANEDCTVFRCGEVERIACPPALSELVLTTTARGDHVVPYFKIPDDVKGFFAEIWRDRLDDLGATARSRREKLTAAAFSYAGYSYWIAMSTVFFASVVSSGMLTPPDGFEYGSFSGMLVKED